MTQKEKENIIKIANHYGEEKQMEQAVEEMAELIQAIQKYKKLNSDNRYLSYIEEMADVCIVLSQLQHLLPVRDKNLFDKIFEGKIDRQLRRIDEENEINNL